MSIGAGLVLLAGTLTFSGATASAEVQSPESNQLRIANSSASHSAGSFAYSATTVDFSTTTTNSVNTDAKIVVAGKTFTAKKDIVTGTAQWSGSDTALNEEDRAAVSAFTHALNSAWVEPANTAKSTIPAHQDLTFRLALLVGEAPLHEKIGTQTVPRPAERKTAKAIPADVSKNECVEDGISSTNPNSAERHAVLIQCQQANEDNILYTGCNEYAALSHDYDNHCFITERIYVGPASFDCMAKCGSGCFVVTGYTYDCGDHDRCNREHNSNMGGCSDEFWEADDDFLWSSNQCG